MDPFGARNRENTFPFPDDTLVSEISKNAINYYAAFDLCIINWRISCLHGVHRIRLVPSDREDVVFHVPKGLKGLHLAPVATSMVFLEPGLARFLVTINELAKI